MYIPKVTLQYLMQRYRTVTTLFFLIAKVDSLDLASHARRQTDFTSKANWAPVVMTD